MNERPHIFAQTPETLAALLTGWGLPRFRAGQVLEWVYGKRVADPAGMSNLSKGDRELLAARLCFLAGAVVRHQTATDGVQKLLMDWAPPQSAALPVLTGPGQPAGALETECVMIPTEDRRTACISSQAGCPVGCRFCASGIGGLDANLTVGQMVEQVWRLGTVEKVGRISHVVFMGMGEPLANFERVVEAIRILTADWALGISARRITVSTVGLPAQIRRLAEIDLPVTLAISLHAPNDAIRRELIPWAEYVTVPQLIEAGQHYFRRTGREVTLEYILLRRVNDRPEHARELAQVAKRLRGNVNLIRYNEVKGLPYERPATEDVLAFQRILTQAGVKAHIRASRGRDIAAACGQLRHEKAAAMK